MPTCDCGEYNGCQYGMQCENEHARLNLRKANRFSETYLTNASVDATMLSIEHELGRKSNVQPTHRRHHPNRQA